MLALPPLSGVRCVGSFGGGVSGGCSFSTPDFFSPLVTRPLSSPPSPASGGWGGTGGSLFRVAVSPLQAGGPVSQVPSPPPLPPVSTGEGGRGVGVGRVGATEVGHAPGASGAGGEGGGRVTTPTFTSVYACVPRVVTYNVNSLSFYGSDGASADRRRQISSALSGFSKDCDIILLQETNLRSGERQALNSFESSGGKVSLNGVKKGTAGTAVIDTPHLTKFFVGHDVPLPFCTKGRVQLRRYMPKDPLSGF